MGMRVVIVGDIVAGVTIVGPFKTSEDAIVWAEENVSDTWTVAPLTAKKDY